ncbi:MAG: hypothetical protein WC543_01390 [Candidatus Omnitrophota bacterium]
MITNYTLEFILHAKNCSVKVIKTSLEEFGDHLVISQNLEENESCNYNVRMVTEDPTLVFDLCAQFGRIRSVKVHENHAA